MPIKLKKKEEKRNKGIECRGLLIIKIQDARVIENIII